MAEVIKGFKELDKKLEALGNPRDARKVLRSAMNSALLPVVRSARQNVPKGSKAHKTYKGRIVSAGFASRSIKKNIKIIKDSIVGRVGVKGEAFYALFFESGSETTPRKPWLEPALESNRTVVLKRFGDGVENWIKKIAAKR